jgi:hypothetical protein
MNPSPWGTPTVPELWLSSNARNADSDAFGSTSPKIFSSEIAASNGRALSVICVNSDSDFVEKEHGENYLFSRGVVYLTLVFVCTVGT